MPTLFLSRGTAAVSIAAINSIGNLGGFVGPFAVGKAKDLTGNAAGGLTFLAVLLFVSFGMMALMRLGSGSDAVIDFQAANTKAFGHRARKSP